MIKKRKIAQLTAVLSLLAAVFAFAEDGINTDISSFSLKLGSTRVFTTPGSVGTDLTVENEHGFPILVQAKSYREDRKRIGDFLITPPLLRLEPRQSTRLRIVQTGGAFPEDRESLQWICVKGIPPEGMEEWAAMKDKPVKPKSVELKVKLSINSCIKLFIRPDSLSANSWSAADKIQWQFADGAVKALNNSPYYINFSQVNFDRETLQSDVYLPPYTEHIFNIKSRVRPKVAEWKIINDFGGISKKYSAHIK